MKNVLFFGALLLLGASCFSCSGSGSERARKDSISAVLHTPEGIKARAAEIFENHKDITSVLSPRFAKIYREADSLNVIYTQRKGTPACLDYDILNGSDGDTVHAGKVAVLKHDYDQAEVNVSMKESENSKIRYTLVYERDRDNWFVDDVDGQRTYLAGAINSMKQVLGSK